MKENNCPLGNLKDEYKMLLLRDKLRQNKWIKHKIKVMTQEEKEKRRQETLRKMRVYKLHASEVDILEEAGEL